VLAVAELATAFLFLALRKGAIMKNQRAGKEQRIAELEEFAVAEGLTLPMARRVLPVGRCDWRGGTMNNQRYARRSEYDRRIGRGDDFAGDAWENTTRTVNGGSWGAMTIVYTVVGHDPNQAQMQGNERIAEGSHE
jgi:hypothetical protein